MRRITNLTSDSAPESRSGGDSTIDRKDDEKDKKDNKDKTDQQTTNPESLPTLQWTPPPSSSSPNNDNFHDNLQLLGSDTTLRRDHSEDTVVEAHRVQSNDDQDVIEVFASEIGEATPAQTVRCCNCKMATVSSILVIILGSIAALVYNFNKSNSDPTADSYLNTCADMSQCYPDLTSPTFDKSKLCECSCYLEDAGLSEEDDQYYDSICLGPEGNCTKPHLYYDMCKAPTGPPPEKPPLSPGMEGDCTKSICYPDLDAPDFSSDQLCACYCYIVQKVKYMEYDRECIRD